jgi:NADH-quinone oxidoreductase subunit J
MIYCCCYLILSNIFILFLDARAVFLVIYFINIVLNLAFMLFLNDLEFFGILLVIVYIGAILVLFLFVIMMLNVSKSDLGSSLYNYLVFGVLYLFLLIVLVSHSLEGGWVDNILLLYYFFNSVYINFFDALNNVFSGEVLGLLMFTYYSPTFIIITTILFISMFGSIALAYVKPLYLYKEVQTFKSRERPLDFSISLERFERCIY